MWCWAACAHMVLKQLGADPPPSQCEIASRRFGRNCCSEPAPCNLPHPMSGIKDLYTHLGVECRSIEGPLEEQALTEEVVKGQPVQIGYVYTSKVGHLVVVIGERYNKKKGVRYFRVADPREKGGRQLLLFGDVRTDSGKGEWKWTWTDMKRRAN